MADVTPQTAPKKKKKSPIPSQRDWEQLNFDIHALNAVKTACERQQRPFPESMQKTLDELQTKFSARRRKVGKYITLGCETVMLFLRNRKLIPVMFAEMQRRYADRSKGEDILLTELSDSTLYNHCTEKATYIYTNDASDGHDYRWNRKYLQIRSNYTETMGRACQSAEMALRQYYATRQLNQEQTISQPVPQQPVQPVPQPNPQQPTGERSAPPMPARPVQMYFNGFQRLVQMDLAASSASETPVKPAKPVQGLLPGFIMPPAVLPEPKRRIRKSTRKLRLPDRTHERS